MRAISLPTLAALALPLPAQGYVATAEAASQLRAQVWQGTQYAQDTLPQGTPIIDATVSKSLQLPGGRADASVRFTFAQAGRRSVLTVTESSRCNPGTQASSAHCGSHSARVTIQSTSGLPFYGYFTLRYTTLMNVGMNGGLASVDLFENGSMDFLASAGSSQSVGHAVLVPAAGMTVLASTAVQSAARQAPATSSYTGALDVEFIPITRCQFQVYGTGCGPVLTGSEFLVNATTRTLQYDCRNAPGSAPAALIFGGTRQNWPLGGGCFLNTEPAVFVPLVTGPTGAVTFTVTTGASLTGIFNAQFLALDGAALRSSLGFENDCRWRP